MASVKETRMRERAAEKVRGLHGEHWKTQDSFQNFIAKLGVGTDNITSAGTYGFNPITRERTLLEWIHRGSWVAGLAVDIIPDDMTRAGIEMIGGLGPDAIEAIENEAQMLNLWTNVRDTIAWARLYGGAIGVAMVDGQDYSTPLRVESIGPGMFRGILPMDRWMVDASINDLVTEPGPHIGMPKYYTVTHFAPGLRGMKIHYSRCLRMDGNRLPFYQRTVENLWGQSVLERLYDRLIAFDSTTAGIAQLVYKSYLRTYAIKDLRELIAVGGEAASGVAKYVSMMAQFQSIEGITLMDAEDRFEANVHGAFAGLGEILIHMGQQISGAIQIPLVRLFGQSPVGLNSTGESDLRTYYDNIATLQTRELKVGVTACYKMMARSLGIELPAQFGIRFRPLWLLSETEKAGIAATLTNAISAGLDIGVSQRACLAELKRSGEITGVWSNIEQDEIDQAGMDVTPPANIAQEAIRAEGQAAQEPPVHLHEHTSTVSPERIAGARFRNPEIPTGVRPNGHLPEEGP